MKRIYRYLPLVLAVIPMVQSCSDEAVYGVDSDINFPASIISSFYPATAYVGDEIEIKGEAMNLVDRVQIGSVDCEIKDKNDSVVVIEVSRAADRGIISVVNEYYRKSETKEYFVPQYFSAVISKWPKEIQRGTSFVLEGENVDLIAEVKIGSAKVSKQGQATRNKVTYSIQDVELEGETAVITVTDKSGQVIKSGEIAVVAPSATYDPSKTLLLADFDNVMPEFGEGWNAAAGTFKSELNGAGVAPMFQNYWSITSDLGNGWDGCYTKVLFNNGGAGYDLSGFKKPHITFLINTNGNDGYFNVAIDGKDIHFTGQDGEYTDDYKFHTDGWEWRSYDLTKLGFDVSGTIPAVEFWARGGNVKAPDDFEVSLDHVMITDGALMPTVVWDMETKPEVYAGEYVLNGATGVSVVPQGESYYTLKAQVDKAWASVIGGLISTEEFDLASMTNAVYLNFLVNTGTTAAGGYFQMVFVQDGYDYVKHLYGNEAYPDNYSINTGGEWQWRSWKMDFSKWDWNPSDAPGFDISKPFKFKAESKSGNIAADKGNSGEFELSLDYVVFTSTPIDNK